MHGPPMQFFETSLVDLEPDHDDSARVHENAILEGCGRVLVATSSDVQKMLELRESHGHQLHSGHAVTRAAESRQARERQQQDRLAWPQVSPPWGSAGEDGRNALFQHTPVIFVTEQRSTR